jgi:hypothetical protein
METIKSCIWLCLQLQIAVSQSTLIVVKRVHSHSELRRLRGGVGAAKGVSMSAQCPTIDLNDGLAPCPSFISFMSGDLSCMHRASASRRSAHNCK